MSDFYFGNKPEIRINESYASLLYADYEDGKKGESIPKVRDKTMLTDTLMKKLVMDTDRTTGMLPPQCRYMDRYENGTLIVVEQPPSVRTIAIDMYFGKVLEKLKENGKLEEYGYNFDEEIEKTGLRLFTLAMPFVIFILTIDNNFDVTTGQIFFRTSQLSGLGDHLLKTPFTNISEGGYICYGDKIQSTGMSIYSMVEHAQKVWWSTIFNADYTYNLDAYNSIPGVCDYYTWKYLSDINPLFIYSAKWIKFPVNLGERLHYTLEQSGLYKNTKNGYNIIEDAFSSRIPTGKHEKPFKRARKKIPLYYDISQSVFLDSEVIANVGDPLPWKGEEMVHIDNYIGFMDSTEPRTMRINRNGNLINVRMTKKFKRFAARKINAYREEESVEIEGKVVHKNEILVFDTQTGGDVYKKVKTIRKAVDGRMELFIGNEYYLSDQFPDFRKYDIDKLELYGKSIKKGDEHILIRDTSSMVPLYTGAHVEFDDAIVDGHDRLSFQFKDINPNLKGHKYRIVSTNIQTSRLMNLNDVEEVKGIFRIGKHLLTNITRENKIWKTEFGYIKEPEASLQRPSITEVSKKCLVDDKLIIKSFDLDISFKIGDKVITSDWDNPLNMLSIKTIQGFKVENLDNSLSLVLQDKHNNLSEHVYIKQNNRVQIGSVRKVKNSHERIKAGTKIIAKKGRIPCFPKKDTNIIVAFITDTGIDEPMVLCSNCCTLWFSDMMENFDRVTMRARKWNELPHADVDLSKIKFQPGDLVEANGDFSNGYGYFIFRENPKHGGSQLKIHSLEYYNNFNEYYHIDRRLMRELRFSSIIAPRVESSTVLTSKVKPGFPNFHGIFNVVSDNLSNFYLPLNLGRMIDVSNFYK